MTNRQRLIALDDFVFRDVRWRFKTEGDNLGLKITPRPGEPSEVSFLDNTFSVKGVATDQVVLDSEFVPQTDPIPAAEKREVRSSRWDAPTLRRSVTRASHRSRGCSPAATGRSRGPTSETASPTWRCRASPSTTT